MEISNICIRAKGAAKLLATAKSIAKNAFLYSIADLLDKHRNNIKVANERDLEKARAEALSDVLIERLRFGENKIDGRIRSLKKIAELPDPVGQYDNYYTRPNGLRVGKVRIPLGVILMIYESRPHVTINAAAFCIKSGNAAILKGGSEVMETNKVLGEIISTALEDSNLPQDAVQILSTSDRSVVQQLLTQTEFIDLVIPRGGDSLIRTVSEQSKIPVIKHYKGVCHCYVDESADLQKALDIVINSKMLMPEVCNALESLLVNEKIANEFLPKLDNESKKNHLELRGCDRTLSVIDAVPVNESDWSTEYLDTILSVRVVNGVDAAIDHIHTYGSGHTDTIVTESLSTAEKFTQNVDSSVVLVNASTMFNDGEELGMGAEIGISTEKLHARGPMGLKDLTSYKYVIFGEGHCKAE